MKIYTLLLIMLVAITHCMTASWELPAVIKNMYIDQNNSTDVQTQIATLGAQVAELRIFDGKVIVALLVALAVMITMLCFSTGAWMLFYCSRVHHYGAALHDADDDDLHDADGFIHDKTLSASPPLRGEIPASYFYPSPPPSVIDPKN